MALTDLLARAFVGSALDRAITGTETRQMSKPVAYTSAPKRSGLGQLLSSQKAPKWSNSATAYRCVLAVMSNAAGSPLVVENLDGVEQPGHWLSQLWAAPNPMMGGVVFGQVLWGGLETRGERFVYLDRGEAGTGPVTGMWPIFDVVQPVVDKRIAGELQGYLVGSGANRVALLPEEVLWLRYPDPNDPWGVLSPLQAAARALGLDDKAVAWQEGEFDHGARPGGVIYLGDLDETQHRKVVNEFREQIEGANNAGRHIFLSSKVAAKYDRMTLSPGEMGWLDTRKANADEVTLAMGVPRDYLMGGTTYENRRAAKVTLWSDNIVPKQGLVASEVVRQLLAIENLRCTFDNSEVDALRDSEDARVTRIGNLVDRDVMMIDEARAEVGLDPLPNGLGELTLTPYRTVVALEAQSALLATQHALTESDRERLARVTPALTGRAPAALAAPLLLPSRVRAAGLSFEQAQRVYDRHETVGVRAVRRLAEQQEREVLAALQRLIDGRSTKMRAARGAMRAAVASGDATLIRAQTGDVFDERRWAEATQDALRGFVSAVWDEGATIASRELGIGLDVFDPAVQLHMDARLEDLAGHVTETTRSAIEDKVLAEGVANGESVDQLAVRLRATFNDLSTWRAETIARTETVGGFNGASYTAAYSTPGLILGRKWLATGDARTRDSHVHLHGSTVKDAEQRYSNGCRFPGDPQGPAGETINCRCVEEYLLPDA